jgi:taurine dioxygenase
MANDAQIDIRRLAGAIGAEIRGVDLRAPIDEGLRKTLRSALLAHQVLFFPDQFLETPHLKAFGRIWGDLVGYDSAGTLDSDPEVVELYASAGLTADVWHTDQSYQPDPALASVMSMIKSPPAGGDTMWTSQYKAYETLSAPMKAFLADLTAIHHLPAALSKKHKESGKTFANEHPIVRTHPETGRPCLYVNRMYTSHIPQLARDESKALLTWLFAHCEDPRFIVRYRWSEGTTAIWDNRCTQHCVVSDFEGERFVRRVTIGGETLETPQSRWPNYLTPQNTAQTRLAAG